MILFRVTNTEGSSATAENIYCRCGPYSFKIISQYLNDIYEPNKKAEKNNLLVIKACRQQHLSVQRKWRAFSILHIWGATVLDCVFVRLSKFTGNLHIHTTWYLLIVDGMIWHTSNSLIHLMSRQAINTVTLKKRFIIPEGNLDDDIMDKMYN